MKKHEYIKKYGKESYERMLITSSRWKRENRAKMNDYSRKWKSENPEKVHEEGKQSCRKEGRRYSKCLEYERRGLRNERRRVRGRYCRMWGRYKRLIAPNSQIHHEWIMGTSEYTGVALVEKDQHMYGYIDVIQILDGEITLFTEEDIRRQEK